MKKKTYILLILSLVLVLSGCSNTPTEEQLSCNHHWEEVYVYGRDVDIYCPICKLDKRIDLRDWNKMKLDEEYKTQ